MTEGVKWISTRPTSFPSSSSMMKTSEYGVRASRSKRYGMIVLLAIAGRVGYRSVAVAGAPP
ncbi:MAG: hypothetical protein C4307_05790 [Chloroflexota bacterium]